MGKLPLLYKKVYLFSGLLAIFGLLVVLFGNHCLKRLNDMDGYGLVVMGAFVLILSVIILIVYAGQEQKYKKAMGFPLLSFVADRNSYNLSADKTASEIKGMNFIALITILFFCVFIAIAGMFLVEEKVVFLLIMLGIAIFSSLAAVITTAYRLQKLKHGSRLVVLAEHGVYTAGEFHAWTGFGTKLIDIKFQEIITDNNMTAGMISGSYQVIGAYRSNTGTFNFVVPAELTEQARKAVYKIKHDN